MNRRRFSTAWGARTGGGAVPSRTRGCAVDPGRGPQSDRDHDRLFSRALPGHALEGRARAGRRGFDAPDRAEDDCRRARDPQRRDLERAVRPHDARLLQAGQGGRSGRRVEDHRRSSRRSRESLRSGHGEAYGLHHRQSSSGWTAPRPWVPRGCGPTRAAESPRNGTSIGRRTPSGSWPTTGNRLA